MHATVQRSCAWGAVMLVCILRMPAGFAQSSPAPAAEPNETRWPHTVKQGDLALMIYQPQLDSWDGHRLKARAAVGVLEGKDDSSPTFGIIALDVRTQVDKQHRLVTMDAVRIASADFPSASPEQKQRWADLIASDAMQQRQTIALDRLEANLQVLAAEKSVKGAAVRNDPPHIIFSTKPAMLVYVDGAPAYRPLAGSSYERVVNTRALLVRNKSGVHYLHVFDGWMTARALEGPWSVAGSPPGDLATVQKIAVDSRQVDLLTGRTDPNVAAPSLTTGPVPQIYVATRPTELLVTEGEPRWTPIPGTQLLFVENTTGHIFKLVSDQRTYVLISGRWFRAADVKGPWEFVASNQLARDFSNIPDDSPKENVKASVAGTPQAKEAVIAASIPETAAVKKSAAKMTVPAIDGEPKFASIDGTPLKYVVNTATPIVMVDAKTYYAVENGVWFDATSLRGPWVVATSVPAIIYTIPPSSPLHYVTYVKIYDVVGDAVYVSSTPGYQGQCVDATTQVVVYGTGYAYTPWIGSVWYGPPVTYGFGVSMRYTPWTGWTIGFGFGWSWGAATVAVGWGWGAYPWWGPYGWGWAWGPPAYPIYPVPYWGGAAVGPRGGAVAWGPGGWVGTTGNMYRRWGSVASVSRATGGFNAWTGNSWAGRAGMAYNSRTGTLAAGQRGAVANVYTGQYAAGARGVATNARTGITAATRQETRGNAYTGHEVSAGQSVFYNRNTGEVTHTSHISGDHGNVVNIDGNIYAGHDGNVYHHTDDGWKSMVGGGGSQPATLDASDRASLDRDRSARTLGEQRFQANRSAAGAMRGDLRRR